MVPLVQEKLDAIRDLCRRHRVLRLYLVGSATGSEFKAEGSDVDFLVVFEPHERVGFDGTYFRLLEALEKLLGRKVDLIERHCVENPYVRASLERTKVPLYAAA